MLEKVYGCLSEDGLPWVGAELGWLDSDLMLVLVVVVGGNGAGSDSGDIVTTR